MTTNVREFNGKVGAFAKALPKSLLVPFVKKLSLEFLTRVVMKTPVKTGFHRGNWQLTIDSSTDATVDRLDPSGAATIEAGLSSLAPLRPFQDVWLSNNGPAIVPLDDGLSQQARAGMTRPTIMEMSKIFNA